MSPRYPTWANATYQQLVINPAADYLMSIMFEEGCLSLPLFDPTDQATLESLVLADLVYVEDEYAYLTEDGTRCITLIIWRDRDYHWGA